MSNPAAGAISRLAPSTAAAVANEFLTLGRNDHGTPPIDQMKLQKLLFYAHAWHLAYTDGPLFDNDVEAWPWGPVVRDIYIQTRNAGRSAITTDMYELGNGSFDIVYPTGVTADLKPFIGSVWGTLRNLTGIQLSNSTHAPGEPWAIVAERLGTDNKPSIPNALIRDVFKAKLH